MTNKIVDIFNYLNSTNGEKLINDLLKKLERLEVPGGVGYNFYHSPCYIDDLYLTTLKIMTTGTFEDTFYIKGKELAAEAIIMIVQMREKDPDFLAKAILYGRTQGYMRLVSITGLVILSAGNNECKELTRLIFNYIIQTPDDLRTFVELCRKGKIRGMGRMVKGLINQWLENMSEIHAIKYGSTAQKFSLRDIYRITRPKLNGKANEIAKYLVRGLPEDSPLAQFKEPVKKNEKFNLYTLVKKQKEKPAIECVSEIIPYKEVLPSVVSEQLPQINAYEIFKKTHDVELIEKYNLPFEVVTAQVSSTESWKALYKARKLPFMFMLRNLNNAKHYGLFKDKEIKERIIEKLTNPETVLYSKQFPFRFYAALSELRFSNCLRQDNEINNALKEAIEISAGNLPEIKGKTLIAIDFSGSMTNPVSKKSKLTYSDIANLFASSLYKKCEAVDLSGFDTKLVKVNFLSRHNKIADNTTLLQKQVTGCGTALSVPINYMIEEQLYYDTLIYLTDNVSWNDSMHCIKYLRNYRNHYNRNLKVIVVNIAPYKYSSISNQEPEVYQISGWSDNVLKLIPMLAEGLNCSVSCLKKVNIVNLIPEKNGNLTLPIAS